MSTGSISSWLATSGSLVILDFAHIVKLLVIDVYSWIYGAIRSIFFGESGESFLKRFYQGKVCIVTGASSGIGESLAKRLATVGAHVVISSRSVNKLEELVAFCHATAPGAKLLPVELDLEKFDKIDEYMERVLRALADGGLPSRIDVLFNNAGVSSRGLAINTDMSTLQRMMAINFLGPVALTKCVVTKMMNEGVSGAIAFVSSAQGKIGIPFRTSYAASKHALQGYSDGLRAELARHQISVTTISPGYVRTSLSMNALNPDGTKYNKMDETTAAGMDPDVLADKILFSVAKGEADILVADTKTNAAILMRTTMPEAFAWIMKKRAKSSAN